MANNSEEGQGSQRAVMPVLMMMMNVHYTCYQNSGIKTASDVLTCFHIRMILNSSHLNISLQLNFTVSTVVFHHMLLSAQVPTETRT
jgi:hypothetical protein